MPCAMGAGSVQVRTFHSAALRQLRYFYPQVFKKDFPRLISNKTNLVQEALASCGLPTDRVLLCAEQPSCHPTKQNGSNDSQNHSREQDSDRHQAQLQITSKQSTHCGEIGHERQLGSAGFVADSAHGQDNLGTFGINLDFGAKALNMHVHQAGVSGVAVLPHFLEKLLACVHLPRFASQGFEQSELARLQGDLAPAPLDHAGQSIQLQIATAQTGIPNSVDAGAFISGYPAIPNRDWLKASAIFRQLPKLMKRISALEERIVELVDDMLDEIERGAREKLERAFGVRRRHGGEARPHFKEKHQPVRVALVAVLADEAGEMQVARREHEAHFLARLAAGAGVRRFADVRLELATGRTPAAAIRLLRALKQ